MIGDSHTAACSGLAVRPSVVAAESKTLKRVKSETALYIRNDPEASASI